MEILRHRTVQGGNRLKVRMTLSLTYAGLLWLMTMEWGLDVVNEE